MTNLISQNENGIIYVENDAGKILGIVSSTKITDEDGLLYEDDALTVLENSGFVLNQDWESEATYIEFIEENGEAPRVIFTDTEVFIK